MKTGSILEKRFAPAAIIVAIAALAAGCGSDNGGGSPSARQLAAEGWDLFVTADYSGAISKFNQAEAIVPAGDTQTLEMIYNGFGWSYMRLGNLEDAIEELLLVGSELQAYTNADTNAGLAILYLAVGDYEDAEGYADDALKDTKYDYSFRYDPSVTHVTLVLIRAIANFHQGDYDDAVVDVQLLGGGEGLNELDPDVAKLLEAIQELRELYGQGLLNPQTGPAAAGL